MLKWLAAGAALMLSLTGCAERSSHPADVDRRFSDGSTSLMAAAVDGDVEATNRLLRAGANPNLRADKGQTALMLAVIEGHVDVVRVLLQAGADPNIGAKTIVPNWEVRPLWWATAERNDQLIELLKSAGAEIDAPRTPAHPGSLPTELLRQ